MPNAYLSRDWVHTTSEKIGEEALESQASLARLLKAQRRLTRFLEENQASMEPATAGVSVYLTGVVIRLFDLAGGRLRSATWAQVRDAAARVQGAVPDLLPLDDDFVGRMREVSWRAQPHILDEAWMSLFDRTNRREEEQDLDKQEAFKVFCLMWVAIEVLDGNWNPARGFEGESDYTYVHIEPDTDDDADDANDEGDEGDEG